MAMDTRGVANFIVRTSLEGLPEAVLTKIKLAVMDVLGTTLGGLDTKSAKSASLWVQGMKGREESTILGTQIKVPVSLATFANSVAASALDYDDGHPTAYHPGSVIIPGALAFAEREGATGKQFLEAAVVGYEVTIGAGAIMRSPPRASSSLTMRYGTGTAGAYGMAAAAAKLLRLGEEETASALGIAEAHAPLSYVWAIPSHGHVPKESIGWGAMAGVSAALLAKEGWAGSCTLFDDPEVDKTKLDAFGKTYETLNIYFKPYAACRRVHSAIDALLEIMQTHSFSAKDVFRVTVETGTWTARFTSERPKNIEQAQYSLPFVLGAALVEGKAGPEQMSERRLSDPVILKEASKVMVLESPSSQLHSLQRYTCIVRVETTDGKIYEVRKDDPRGDPRNPMSVKELEAKFLSLASKRLGNAGATEVLRQVRHLEGISRLDEFVRLYSSRG